MCTSWADDGGSIPSCPLDSKFSIFTANDSSRNRTDPLVMEDAPENVFAGLRDLQGQRMGDDQEAKESDQPEKKPKAERQSKAQLNLFIPSNYCKGDNLIQTIAFKTILDIGELFDLGVKPPDYGRYAINCEYIQVKTVPQETVMFKRLDENIMKPRDLDRYDLPRVASYRQRVVTIAEHLASNQYLETWFYKLSADRKGIPCHVTIPEMIYEYEICFSVDKLRLPTMCIPIIQEYNENTEEAMMKIDKLFISFNFYPNTTLIPPFIGKHLREKCSSLVEFQLCLNQWAGFRVFDPDSLRVIQVNIDGPRGFQIMYSSRNVNKEIGTGTDSFHIIPPIVFFNQDMCIRSTVDQGFFREKPVAKIFSMVQDLIAEDDPNMPKHFQFQQQSAPRDCRMIHIAKITANRLKEMGTTKFNAASHIELPPINTTHATWNMDFQGDTVILDSIHYLYQALHSCSNSELSLPIFRWCNTGRHFGIITANAEPIRQLKEIAFDMISKVAFPLHDTMGCFIYHWQCKSDPIQSLSDSQKRQVLNSRPPNSPLHNNAYFLTHAPRTVTIIIIPVANDLDETALPYIKNSLYDQMRENFEFKIMDLFEITHIDDCGTIQNIFTSAAAKKVNAIYKTEHYIVPKYHEFFIDYLTALTRTDGEANLSQKISATVAEGSNKGFSGKDLLSYVESIFGTMNRDTIISSIRTQESMTADLVVEKPKIPLDLLTYDAEKERTYDNNQISIYKFVKNIAQNLADRKATLLNDKRNLLICGPPKTRKTSFGLFLDKYFKCFWKGVGMAGSHEFWQKVPSDTEIIIMDEWEPQSSDFNWINKVGEGTRHNVDQKYSDKNYIPEGCFILLMTNRDSLEIKNFIMNTGKRGPSSSKDNLWQAFVRRFNIVTLTGERFITPLSTIRDGCVPPEFSINHLPIQRSVVPDLDPNRIETQMQTSTFADLISIVSDMETPTKAIVEQLLNAALVAAKDAQTTNLLNLQLTILNGLREPTETRTIKRIIQVCMTVISRLAS